MGTGWGAQDTQEKPSGYQIALNSLHSARLLRGEDNAAQGTGAGASEDQKSQTHRGASSSSKTHGGTRNGNFQICSESEFNFQTVLTWDNRIRDHQCWMKTYRPSSWWWLREGAFKNLEKKVLYFLQEKTHRDPILQMISKCS